MSLLGLNEPIFIDHARRKEHEQETLSQDRFYCEMYVMNIACLTSPQRHHFEECCFDHAVHAVAHGFHSFPRPVVADYIKAQVTQSRISPQHTSRNRNEKAPPRVDNNSKNITCELRSVKKGTTRLVPKPCYVEGYAYFNTEQFHFGVSSAINKITTKTKS